MTGSYKLPWDRIEGASTRCFTVAVSEFGVTCTLLKLFTADLIVALRLDLRSLSTLGVNFVGGSDFFPG